MVNKTQTVYVIDDDSAFLKTMSRWLVTLGYEVGVAASARGFLAKMHEVARGCVVADLNMPDMNGVELQQTLALSQNPLPVIILTGCGDIPTSVKAMRLGAEDFLMKTADKNDLVAAIERALKRDRLDCDIRAHEYEVKKRFGRLSDRENEVLRHVLSAKLNKQIAYELGIDERSVKRHRSNLMSKLEVKSVVELVELATREEISTIKRLKLENA